MADDWSANTTLLLHMEGSNNSTTFTDNSLFPKTVSVFGNAKISTAKSKWGNGSGYFDGNGDYLSIPHSIAVDLTSNDFTLETYVFLTTSPAAWQIIFSTRPVSGNYGCVLRVQTTGKVIFFITGVTSTNTESSSILPLNTWIHLAITRDYNSIRMFVDGVLETTVTTTDTGASGDICVIGTSYPSSPNYYLPGYLQDLRITKGVARYTENFTPPTAILPNPSPPTGLIIPSGYSPDLYDGGRYRIVGTVTELGIEGAYRVRLFDRQSARCVRETWSNASGAYAFDNLAYRPNGYFAVAYDHGDNPLNAAIADLITPELMP